MVKKCGAIDEPFPHYDCLIGHFLKTLNYRVNG